MPVIVYFLITDQFKFAAALFLLAGVSDAIDGFIAKQWNMRSELGAYLDPLADKALLTSVYVALTFKGYLPVWLTVFVVSRDFLIIGGVVLAWIVGRPVEMAPLMISKANTTAQIALAGIVLAGAALEFDFGGFVGLVIVLTGALTILSAIAYTAAWLKHMSDMNGNEG